MASELGGCFAASPVSGVGVMRMELNRRAGAAHLNRGDARNDVGGADGDEELVRSSVHLLINILAPDVGVSREETASETRSAKTQFAVAHLHRCTPRIQRPNCRPIQVEMEA